MKQTQWSLSYAAFFKRVWQKVKSTTISLSPWSKKVKVVFIQKVGRSVKNLHEKLISFIRKHFAKGYTLKLKFLENMWVVTL